MPRKKVEPLFYKIKTFTYRERILLKLYSKSIISKNECWDWCGSKDKDGYGIISYGGKTFGITKKSWKAHRLIYSLLRGELPNEMLVCHKCDNPSCININHLFLGLPKDNSQDREKKKRGRTQNQNGEKNHSSKLTEKDVILIRKLYSEGILAKELGKIFNIHPNHICRLIDKKRWKHL